MHRIAILTALALAACVPVGDAAPTACGAPALARFVGEPLVILQTTGLPPGARVIRPGDAVTEDYSEQRLNVEVDANDTVTRIWCG